MLGRAWASLVVVPAKRDLSGNALAGRLGNLCEDYDYAPLFVR